MKVAVIDTETTGLGPFARVVELGLVVVDLATGALLLAKDCLVRQPLSGAKDEQEALALNGLSRADLEGAWPPDQVRAWWISLFAGVDRWTAYNRQFDAKMLERDQLVPPVPPGECLLTAAWRARGGPRPKLPYACQWAGVAGPGDQAHGALPDALAAARLLVALYRRRDWSPHA